MLVQLVWPCWWFALVVRKSKKESDHEEVRPIIVELLYGIF